MNSKVVVVDYGLGNLLSVARAFKHCGVDVIFSDSPADIENADRLVLPGVGAFAVGMAELNSRHLADSLREYAKKERPFLGICLGMQMMLEKSEEFGNHIGLGLISGRVKAIPTINKEGNLHKIPHIGWNNLIFSDEVKSWNGTVLANTQLRSAVYFVHSYMAVPTKKQYCLADCNYNGIIISAVLRYGTLYGCQFHPEKSGAVGLQIINEFLKL